MPFLAAIGVGAGAVQGAIAAAPAIALVTTGALTAAGEVIKCNTGPDRCGDKVKIKARDDIPTARLLRFARRQAGACGVPQFNFDMCHEDLKAVVVQTSKPEPGTARFDNVPASCLNLATALTGGCGVAPPYPQICGSACMQYTGLTEEQLDQLSDYLTPYAA